jgi:hypothetical protein
VAKKTTKNVSAAIVMMVPLLLPSILQPTNRDGKGVASLLLQRAKNAQDSARTAERVFCLMAKIKT